MLKSLLIHNDNSPLSSDNRIPQSILFTPTIKELSNIHIAQVLNYLKATNKKVGLLINFGAESLEYKRIAL